MLRIIIGLLAFLQVQNYCLGQVEFSQCKLFEEFFSKIRFNEIPYYSIGAAKPSISISEAKDTLIEIIDIDIYETRLVNQKDLIEKQWNEFYGSDSFVSKRDLITNSFHLINSQVELRKLLDIKNILSTYYVQLSIDTAKLSVAKIPVCDSFKRFNDQNFIVDKSINDLSEEERYNLRGFFRFGTVHLTGDQNYAITTYDIYHKWIDSNGKETGMETGGGGILIISLKDEQKISYLMQLSDY